MEFKKSASACIRTGFSGMLSIIFIAFLLSFPIWAGSYAIYIVSLAGIYSIVAIALGLLTGDAGQISLGHAGFFAVGAYTAGILTASTGMPFLISILLGGILTAFVGVIVALPALRLKGLYLAIATLVFGVIVQRLIYEWSSLTGGGAGLKIPISYIWSLRFGETPFYYLIVFLCILAYISRRNLLSMDAGRALFALRDSEVAASCIGINLTYQKIRIFALSAFYAGIAGGIYAHLLRYINPAPFNIFMNINFLAMTIIGGLTFLQGPILGAVFFTFLPEILRPFPDFQAIFFGIVLVLCLLFLPEGLWKVVDMIKSRIDVKSISKDSSLFQGGKE